MYNTFTIFKRGDDLVFNTILLLFKNGKDLPTLNLSINY